MLWINVFVSNSDHFFLHKQPGGADGRKTVVFVKVCISTDKDGAAAHPEMKYRVYFKNMAGHITVIDEEEVTWHIKHPNQDAVFAIPNSRGKD